LQASKQTSDEPEKIKLISWGMTNLSDHQHNNWCTNRQLTATQTSSKKAFSSQIWTIQSYNSENWTNHRKKRRTTNNEILISTNLEKKWTREVKSWLRLKRQTQLRPNLRRKPNWNNNHRRRRSESYYGENRIWKPKLSVPKP
jgi:hypothetical protein